MSPSTAGGWDRGMKLEQTEKNEQSSGSAVKKVFLVQHPVGLGP